MVYLQLLFTVYDFMKRKIFFYTLLCQLLTAAVANAQTNELSGWVSWFHTQRFSKHWGAAFDGQLRSANQGDYLKTVLLRPSIVYHFGNKNVSLGYTYVGNNSRSGEVKTFRPESRIFEQFIITQKAGVNTQITHRFRLEQRFQGETTTQQSVFSQRLRYFIRGIIPLSNDQSTFTNGSYLALQDEIFGNVQNKNQVNGHLFDQNRAYVAFGHRFNKMVDLELGYINQYVKQPKTYSINNVIQLVLYTRFGSVK